jgi:membrane-bound lytic murein transglycosylase D
VQLVIFTFVFMRVSILKYSFLSVALICICGLFIYATLTDDDQHQKAFESNYNIYSLAFPEKLTFANETIPLDRDDDTRERYDRELLTNVYWQSQTILMIKRAHKFFPIIEPILAKHGMPDDLKYLALAESGLQNLVSPAGAAGYWQMLDATAKMYGLEVSNEVDERYNLEKSTEAACKYFKEAYSIFNSWALVAASYNMGIEGVRKQLQQQGVTSYYDLWLNTETARYVFRILAIKEIVKRPAVFGFHIPEHHKYQHPKIISVKVGQTIPDLIQFSLEMNCNYKMLKQLNPWLKNKQLGVSGKNYYIQLPAERLLASKLSNLIVNDTLVYN